MELYHIMRQNLRGFCQILAGHGLRYQCMGASDQADNQDRSRRLKIWRDPCLRTYHIINYSNTTIVLINLFVLFN